MRTFIDAILEFIATTSLTDDEWSSLSDLTSLTYTITLYGRLLVVIDARESVSGVRDRLTNYFLARNVPVVAAPAGKSNIFIGEDLS